MKKLSVLFLTVLLSSTIFSATASASPTTGSVSDYHSTTSSFSSFTTLSGAGKYMKFICTYSGTVTNGGYCELRKNNGNGSTSTISNLYVGQGMSYRATDVWLDKGEEYTLVSNASLSSSFGYVTATISER